MSDLISREDALNAFGLTEKSRKYGGDHSGYDTRMLYEIQDVLESLPSAEPEPKIIHCKDCKFYTPMNRKLKIGICDMTMHHLGDDGFCSTAEKRGE